jgi:hypothetical protein
MPMNLGHEPLLPVESQISTRSFLEWQKAKTRAEFLRLRTLQFQRRDEDRISTAPAPETRGRERVLQSDAVEPTQDEDEIDEDERSVGTSQQAD